MTSRFQFALLLAMPALFASCRSSQGGSGPSIAFTKVPPANNGGPNKTDTIGGRVNSAKPGQRVVLYAKSGVWWVQPMANQPFTEVRPDGTWQASIHLGTEYAALLVDASYVPPATTQILPTMGGSIAAVVSTVGTGSFTQNPEKPLIVRFSGYDWVARQLPSERGGKENSYDPRNAWTDRRGFLHLRVTRQGERWVCSEVKLNRSLGPGTYLFTVSDVSKLDPAAVMTLYTWDDLALDEHHREIDVEVSQWGDAKNRNAQYVVQPYYEPSNVFRFEAPPGRLTYSFRWTAGAVTFRTVQGDRAASQPLSEHAFTSGVPSPGGERVQLNLYAFGNSRTPLRNEAEAVIEKFEYLP